MIDQMAIAIVAIVALFIVLPAMLFHYITLWRKQKMLLPDDERMLEDLWRSAKAMERRIATMEQLIEAPDDDVMADRPRRRRPSDRFED